MIGLHKDNISFEILETINPKTLVFLDSSDYIQSPERPLLEITLPGYDKYFLVNVIPKRLNTFNSSTIGLGRVLNCSELIDLPDGLYSAKYKICPYDYKFITKKFIRTTLLNQRLENLYNQIDLNLIDNEFEKDLLKVYILVEGSKTIADSDSKKAVDYFNTASKIVDKLFLRICKNCK